MRITLFLAIAMLVAVAWRAQNNPVAVCAAPTQTAPAYTSSSILTETNDGGKTWQDISLGLPENLKVSSVLEHNGTLLLGTESGYLYSSSNLSSGNWDKESVGPMSFNPDGIFPTGRSIRKITAGQNCLYVSVHESGFYRRINSGVFWQPMHEKLTDKDIQGIVETPDGGIIVSCPTGVFKTKNDGETWENVYPGVWSANILRIADVLYLNCQKGVLRSVDSGLSWETILDDPGAVYEINATQTGIMAHRVAAPPNNTAPNILLRTSADNGTTWTDISAGLKGMEQSMRITEVMGFLFSSHRDGISRSDDGGKTWKQVRNAPEHEENLLYYDLIESGQTLYTVVRFWGC